MAAAMRAPILAISSRVGAGRVGLSAIEPALAALGLDTIALPSVTLSNHAGWPHVAATPTPPDVLRAMIAAVDANGWLDNVRTVLSGYLPSAAHVGVVARAVDQMRARGPVTYVCDPVLGDAPKGLYAPVEAAEAIRRELLPRADAVTPNWFELGWLARNPEEPFGEDLRRALSAAKRLGVPRVYATSAPVDHGQIGVLALENGAARIASGTRLPQAPNGAGDVFSALIAGGLDVAAAVGRLNALIARSADAPHLCLVDRTWAAAPDAPARLLD